MTRYCTCEQPVMEVEHDTGCRRCGLPVDFTPRGARLVWSKRALELSV
jgi:hypothetical protein